MFCCGKSIQNKARKIGEKVELAKWNAKQLAIFMQKRYIYCIKIAQQIYENCVK